MTNDSRITSLRQRIDAQRAASPRGFIRYDEHTKQETLVLIADYGVSHMAQVLSIADETLHAWVRKHRAKPASTLENERSSSFIDLTAALAEEVSGSSKVIKSQRVETSDAIDVKCTPMGLEMTVSLDQLAQLLLLNGGAMAC